MNKKISFKDEVNQLQKQVENSKKQQLDNLLSKLDDNLLTYFLIKMKEKNNQERGYFYLSSETLFKELSIEYSYLTQKDNKKVVKYLKSLCKEQGLKIRNVCIYAYVFRFEADIHFIKNSFGFL